MLGACAAAEYSRRGVVGQEDACGCVMARSGVRKIGRHDDDATTGVDIADEME
jgi:hypothetical protein